MFNKVYDLKDIKYLFTKCNKILIKISYVENI